MIDFNFLRIRWPKLAAIAADASRLVEVSPTSAIGTMQNFCEWAADIALDFYDIDTPNGTAQPQKLESLKSTNRVPPEILTKFQNIMNGGTGTTSSYRSYRMHDDVVEARRLIEDMQEIARWLHREADRAGWSSPASPSAGRGRASRSTLGPSYSNPSGGSRSSGIAGGLLAYLEPYMPIVLIAGGVILVVGLGIGLAFALSGKGDKTTGAGKTAVVVSSTPSAEPTDALNSTEPIVSASPAVEQSVYLDELDTASVTTAAGFHKQQWTFKDKTYKFVIDTRPYQHGLGMFVPYKSITNGNSGSNTVKYQLDGKYDTLRFDLGVDGDLNGYDSKNGKYQIKIFADENTTAIWDSRQLAYDGTKLGVSVPVTGVTTLKIRLTEFKGTGTSTLNVVLGNAKLVSGSGGTTDPGNGEPTNEDSPSPDNGASASPDAGASPTPGADDTGAQ